MPRDIVTIRRNAGYFTPAVTVWSPLLLTGLVGWYRAADAGGTNRTVFTDAGVTLATNGQAVQQWNDESGLGNDLTQATLANQPAWQSAGFNGLPTVLNISGNNHCLTNTTFPMGTGTTGSCFFAGFVDATSGPVGRVICYGGPPSGNDQNAGSGNFFLIQPSGTLQAFAWFNTFMSPTPYTGNTNYRMGCVFDGTNGTLYQNNVASTPTAGGPVWATPGTLSVWETVPPNQGEPTGGAMSEIIVTTSALSSTDRNNLDTYLKAHWGL
jgi:hypothetical protein